MQRIVRVIDLISDGLAILAGTYLVVIMVGIVFQATARTFGFSGSSHIFTFTEFGLLYIVMAGSPWLVREKGHVYIELVSAALPRRLLPIYSRMVAALAVIVCLAFVWYSGAATLKSFERGASDAVMRSIDMPRWLLLISMPICFGLMAAQFARFVVGRETMHTGEAGVHE
jgi:TRAP-type C4-dicarboxylate transport system permease small subunit